MTRIHNPPHPGATLLEDVLPALGLTVTDAAAQLGVTRSSGTVFTSAGFPSANLNEISHRVIEDKLTALEVSAMVVRARRLSFSGENAAHRKLWVSSR